MIRAKKWLEKKAKKGFTEYPIATVAFYGPTHKLATKIAVGITLYENAEPLMMRWNSKMDIRDDKKVMAEIMKVIKDNKVQSVLIVDKIIGCPHEEGHDYPEGKSCQECSYWLTRDRWTGDSVH